MTDYQRYLEDFREYSSTNETPLTEAEFIQQLEEEKMEGWQ